MHKVKFQDYEVEWHNDKAQGRIAQSVNCLAADMCLVADPGVANSILVRSPGSGPILWRRSIIEWFLQSFSSLPLIQEGRRSVTSEGMCRKFWLTASSSLPKKKVWLGELSVPTWPLTIDWDIKNHPKPKRWGLIFWFYRLNSFSLNNNYIH